MFSRVSGLVGAAAALAAPALAQETPQGGEAQTFEPAYFSRYNPNTALDMVQQVPGFSVQEGESVRGFGGSAGNILINGERPSTKTGLAALLQRVPASSVIRIELVTGASATLDMRGQTKVANVLVRESALAEPVTFDVFTRYTPDGRISGSAQASTQRQVFGGALNLSGTVSTQSGNGPGGGSFVNSGRAKYGPTGAQTEHAYGFVEQQPLYRQLNAEYERDMGWAALRLNGGYTLIDVESDRYFEILTPDANGPLTGRETNRTRTHDESFTVGGDIERKFGDINAKLITFHKRSEGDTDTVFSQFTGAGALTSATTNRPQSKSGESILRGQANWKLSDHHSVEFAAETAYNFLESGTEMFAVNGAGAVTVLALPGSNTKVEEFRNEFQISDVWTISPQLTIEPGFKMEFSRIEQDVQEREFEYPKPSITGTWRIQPGQQLRLSYEREVAQLSFNDFVSSIELTSNLTTGGNASLVPERTWAFNAEFEQRFWKGGVLTLLGSFDQVQDVQDFVPLTVTTTSGPIVIDAPGNIGDGERWSLGFRASVPMENFGLKGARLDASLAAGGAEVVDPVTGRTREFSDEFKESWSVAFRQDFPASKFSYGFRWSDGGPGTAYRYNETSRRARDDADLQIWVETSRWFGLKIRAGVDDAFAADFSRTRVIYTGAREASPLNRIEQTHSSNGVQPFIRVSGKF